MLSNTIDLERHLRVELIDDAHHDWPAVRRQVGVAGRADRLLLRGGQMSARQAVVAAFLGGRVVAHAAFHVVPARSPAGPTVVARMDSRSVDAPFAGTAVEQVMMSVVHSRARTMGCQGVPSNCEPLCRAA